MSSAGHHSSSFDVNFVELDSSKMITTGDSNYAICNQNFPSNWRSASVNGDDAVFITKDKQVVNKKLSALTDSEKRAIEEIKSSLKEVITKGPFNTNSKEGFCKLTTFDKHGSQSVMGRGGPNGKNLTSSAASTSSNGMSISKNGNNSFIVSKKDFPFNWQRLFINDDVVTAVFKDGKVIMMPQELMKKEEQDKIGEIKKEVGTSVEGASRAAHSMLDSLKSPFEFVNKAMSGIFG